MRPKNNPFHGSIEHILIAISDSSQSTGYFDRISHRLIPMTSSPVSLCIADAPIKMTDMRLLARGLRNCRLMACSLITLLSISACDSSVAVNPGVTANPDGTGNPDVTVTTVEPVPAFTQACVDTELGLVICPASDMAKPTRTGNLLFEHPDLDWSNGPLQLHAARNETIGFQLILRKTQPSSPLTVDLTLEPVVSATDQQLENGRSFSQSLYSAFYHPIDDADYSWGPTTQVLPWPADYPDALVPLQDHCQASPLDRFSAIATPTSVDTNQALWVDTYVHTDTTPGVYSQSLVLTVDDRQFKLPLQISVYSSTLPDKPSINAIGELYRTYSMEGAGNDVTGAEWRRMAHCYQQLAHQHRMVFIERIPFLLTDEQMSSYTETIDPALSGELFTAANGYVGPGVNTPAKVWRTPWPQEFDGTQSESVSDAQISRYQSLSAEWNDIAQENNWNATDYFAYIFDEVEGRAQTTGSDGETRDQYIARVHDDMARLQIAIDAGSPQTTIDLLWTSHSNPAIWENKPDLDLTGKIRLWAPNASAADTAFLQDRIAAGDNAWFYHSGHPAVGAHSINTSGIEMRTWGVIGARYGFQGQFMWAVNLGSDDFAYRDPQYTPADTRAGNGVFVYPGYQLDRIGYPKQRGPVPSMRLKSWRRGLQDAELYYLARQQSPAAADTLMRQQMPSALTDGQGLPGWSSDTADWIDFHKKLLQMSSE